MIRVLSLCYFDAISNMKRPIKSCFNNVGQFLGGGDFPEHIASIDDSVSDFIGHAVLSVCLDDVTEVGCWQVVHHILGTHPIRVPEGLKEHCGSRFPHVTRLKEEYKS